LNKVVTIFVFWSLLVQCFAHYSVVALFALRRDYIAKNLCENKTRPALKCGGKCYLRKQLNKVDEPTGNTNTLGEREEVEFPVGIVPDFYQMPRIPRSGSSVRNPVLQHLYGTLVARTLLRPPAALA
jgi:hypothetical protein